MALGHSASVVSDSLIGSFDPANKRSFRGEVTTNLIGATPLSLSIYAYASGPVATANQYDATSLYRTVNRYTITSAVNVARAMITPSLSTGTAYTFSCVWKYNGSNATVTALTVSAAKGFPEGGGGNTFSSETSTHTPLGNGWTRTVYTFSLSASPTSAAIITYGIATGADSAYVGKTFDVYDEQLEAKSYATTYTAATRGSNVATGGGLVNLVADTNHGFLHGGVRESSSSNGVTVFDGLNDYIGLASTTKAYHWTPSGIGNNNLTIEMWAKITDNDGFVFSRPWNGSGEYNYYVFGTGLVMQLGGQSHTTYFSALPTNVWAQFTLVITPTTVALYRNSAVLVAPTAHGITNNTPTYGDADLPLVIMSLYPYNDWGGLTGFSIGGDVGPVRVYRRALSAAEIKQNFNAARSRYGL